MRDWVDVLNTLGREEQPCVLATVIRVDGSSYRKPGAPLLLLEDGRRVGSLSAGCLEEDLAERAGGLFAAWKSTDNGEGSQTVVYDMSSEDDLSWGRGAGCRGLVHVLLEPVHTGLRELLRAAGSHLLLGHRATIVRLLKERGGTAAVSGYLFITEEGRPLGSWGDGARLQPETVLAAAGYALENGSVGEMKDDSGARLLVQCWEPPQRLVVFGAGADAAPLVTMAAKVGFAVTVADWRPALCAKMQDADAVLLGAPEELVASARLTPGNYAVVMTHHFRQDQLILSALLRPRLNLRYLGVMGTRERTVRLLGGGPIPAGIQSPVGLAIGAEGPEEIAVSILADLVRAYRSRSAAPAAGALC